MAARPFFLDLMNVQRCEVGPVLAEFMRSASKRMRTFQNLDGAPCPDAHALYGPHMDSLAEAEARFCCAPSAELRRMDIVHQCQIVSRTDNETLVFDFGDERIVDGLNAPTWKVIHMCEEYAMFTYVDGFLQRNAHADVTVVNDQGQTPLHWACNRGWQLVARLLVDHGAQVNLPNGAGTTALDACMWSSHGNHMIMRHLMDSGKVDVNRPVLVVASDGGDETSSLLHMACSMDIAWLVDALLAQGADPNRRNARGIPPMAYTEPSQLSVLAALLKAGADVNADTDGSGGRFIMECVFCGDYGAVQMLVGAGALLEHACVHEEAPGAMTPLMYAVYRCDEPIASLLLAEGADLFTRNARGQTAMSFVRSEQIQDTLFHELRKRRALAAKHLLACHARTRRTGYAGDSVLQHVPDLCIQEIVSSLVSKPSRACMKINWHDRR